MVTISETPFTEELKHHINQGFSAYAIQKRGRDGKGGTVCFAAFQEETLVGAVAVSVFWGQLHIKYLFVEEGHRGKGIGTKLMSHALAFGHHHKCQFAFVETMSFQAPVFYKKLGFEVDFIRSGFEGNTSFYYLQKKL